MLWIPSFFKKPGCVFNVYFILLRHEKPPAGGRLEPWRFFWRNESAGSNSLLRLCVCGIIPISKHRCCQVISVFPPRFWLLLFIHELTARSLVSLVNEVMPYACSFMKTCPHWAAQPYDLHANFIRTCCVLISSGRMPEPPHPISSGKWSGCFTLSFSQTVLYVDVFIWLLLLGVIWSHSSPPCTVHQLNNWSWMGITANTVWLCDAGLKNGTKNLKKGIFFILIIC